MSEDRCQDLVNRPSRNREIEEELRLQTEVSAGSLERRLAQACFRLRHSDEGLIGFLRELPPVQRMTARVVMLRELGSPRGAAICNRAFGRGQAVFPGIGDGQVMGATGAQGLYEDAMAQGRRDLLHALGRPEVPQSLREGAPLLHASLSRAAERRGAMIYRRQADDGSAADPEHPAVREALRRVGSGDPLPDKLRKEMEAHFGVSFVCVRVHTDGLADQAARAVQARAFAVGEDIFFAEGAFAPGSVSGIELLAHELAHVVQWQQGRLSNEAQGTYVSSPDAPLEREAERTANTVLENKEEGTPSRAVPDTGGRGVGRPAPSRHAIHRQESHVMTLDPEQATPEQLRREMEWAQNQIKLLLEHGTDPANIAYLENYYNALFDHLPKYREPTTCGPEPQQCSASGSSLVLTQPPDLRAGRAKVVVDHLQQVYGPVVDQIQRDLSAKPAAVRSKRAATSTWHRKARAGGLAGGGDSPEEGLRSPETYEKVRNEEVFITYLLDARAAEARYEERSDLPWNVLEQRLWDLARLYAADPKRVRAKFQHSEAFWAALEPWVAKWKKEVRLKNPPVPKDMEEPLRHALGVPPAQPIPKDRLSRMAQEYSWMTPEQFNDYYPGYAACPPEVKLAIKDYFHRELEVDAPTEQTVMLPDGTTVSGHSEAEIDRKIRQDEGARRLENGTNPVGSVLWAISEALRLGVPFEVAQHLGTIIEAAAPLAPNRRVGQNVGPARSMTPPSSHVRVSRPRPDASAVKPRSTAPTRPIPPEAPKPVAPPPVVPVPPPPRLPRDSVPQSAARQPDPARTASPPASPHTAGHEAPPEPKETVHGPVRVVVNAREHSVVWMARDAKTDADLGSGKIVDGAVRIEVKTKGVETQVRGSQVVDGLLKAMHAEHMPFRAGWSSVMPDNLFVFNSRIMEGLASPEAALATWTGRACASRNLSRATVLPDSRRNQPGTRVQIYDSKGKPTGQWVIDTEGRTYGFAAVLFEPRDPLGQQLSELDRFHGKPVDMAEDSPPPARHPQGVADWQGRSTAPGVPGAEHVKLGTDSYSYSFKLGENAWAHRVHMDELMRTSNSRDVLFSTGYFSCAGLAVRSKRRRAGAVLTLGHIMDADPQGQYKRVKGEIEHEIKENATHISVLVSLDPRALDGSRGTAVDAFPPDVTRQLAEDLGPGLAKGESIQMVAQGEHGGGTLEIRSGGSVRRRISLQVEPGPLQVTPKTKMLGHGIVVNAAGVLIRTPGLPDRVIPWQGGDGDSK